MVPEIFFEYKKERAFVRDRDKNVVFQELLDRFKKNSLPYLSRPSFPASFALSKHRNIEKNSYKYNSFPVTTLPDSPDGTSPTLAKSLFEKETELCNLAKSCNLN
ncbi:MAG: hypothetical protein ACXU9G_04350 [Syntrophales bacterium]